MCCVTFLKQTRVSPRLVHQYAIRNQACPLGTLINCAHVTRDNDMSFWNRSTGSYVVLRHVSVRGSAINSHSRVPMARMKNLRVLPDRYKSNEGHICHCSASVSKVSNKAQVNRSILRFFFFMLTFICTFATKDRVAARKNFWLT